MLITGGLKYALQLRNLRAYILLSNYKGEEAIAKSTIFDLTLKVIFRGNSKFHKRTGIAIA
jgi:hypothetical protein